MTRPIKLDIWSDIACPWCYIGKRRLEDGIARFREVHGPWPVEIEYHSFELAPDTPVDFDGTEVDFLIGRLGLSASRAEQALSHVTSIARSVGLEYDFGRLQHTNTVKAHQLLHHAKGHGVQLEMKERLLRAYFVEGRHVGRVEDLADLAAEVGLDRAEALRSLQADEHLAAVHADQSRAAELGIHGVPFFVLDGRYGISGAQQPETFTAALEQVVADWEEVQAS